MKTVKLKHLCFSILFCLFVTNAMVISLVQAAQTIPGVQRLEEGIAAYGHGEYDDAVFKFEMAVYQIPADKKDQLWDALFYLGLSYLLLGDADEAKIQFSKAQEIIKNKLPDVHKHSPKIVKLFGESIKLKKPEIKGMVFVKGGCFEMGDTFGDGQDIERPVHEVCVDDFYIGKYEVTNAEFERFISETGYVTTAENEGTGFGVSGSNWGSKKGKGINWRHPLRPSDTINNKMNYPVAQISWDDTQEYIKWFNKKTGKEYSLPTEAEWEYAARSGGKREKWAGTSNKAELGRYVWYRYNSGKKTHSVGQKKPNGLGIYDMSGNVKEWCQDIYSSDAYRKHQRNNPIYTGSGSNRVIRGGSWRNLLIFLEASYRSEFPPGFMLYNLGFRLVRTVD